MNERLEELLRYLDALTKLHAANHFVNAEIKKVVAAIEMELKL